MVPDVTGHDHCRYCGDAVPEDQAYCSVECYNKDHARIGRERRSAAFLTAAAIVSAVGVLAAGFLL